MSSFWYWLMGWNSLVMPVAERINLHHMPQKCSRCNYDKRIVFCIGAVNPKANPYEQNIHAVKWPMPPVLLTSGLGLGQRFMCLTDITLCPVYGSAEALTQGTRLCRSVYSACSHGQILSYPDSQELSDTDIEIILFNNWWRNVTCRDLVERGNRTYIT